MMITPLYHWAPASKRSSILANGLKVGSEPTIESRRLFYICCSADPQTAWKHSAQASKSKEDEWDLWMIWVAPTDSVTVLPQWGADIREVRIANDIPHEPDRLWLVGSRGLINKTQD
jgi:hypothetical protein